MFSGADVNLQDKNGNTPLHLCAKSGYVECCRKLTPSGVNVNCVNFEKRTCLHLSAFKGSVECLDFLIASGANINVVDKHKRLPLHYAASRSWFDCTFTLVCSGNNSWITFFEYLDFLLWFCVSDMARIYVNVNFEKRTCLHLRAFKDSVECLDFLIALCNLAVMVWLHVYPHMFR